MAETHLVACLVDYFDNCPGYQRWDKNQPHFLFDQLNDNLFFCRQTNKFVCLSTLYKTIKYTYMQVLLCCSVEMF